MEFGRSRHPNWRRRRRPPERPLGSSRARFAGARRSHQGNRVITDRHSARMETDCAAMAQQEAHHGPEQIRACIFEGALLRPVGPGFAAAPVQDESGPIGISEAKMLFPG